MAEFEIPSFIKHVEPKWQKHWLENQSFKAANPGEKGSEKPKYYCLDMFPYPSGEGLHVGHLEGYTATDIICRYKRMRGFNVLHPMGWDAFGLPAEQFAITKGVHPAITTEKNVANFKRQINLMGFSYDWSREVNTTDPSYYKWTQWIFCKLFEKGLAYESEKPVNWCPALGTVLANEEVIDGKSERGGHPVEKRPMRQWVLKITEYADKLLQDLELCQWPDATKEMQKNWIGKSEGAQIKFKVENSAEEIEVFTTRPDTLFGVTFLVLAPEHKLVSALTTAAHKADVEKYVAAVANKTDLQRTDLAVEKTGVDTGGFVIHPLTGKQVPVWIADYVLNTYGTGAIMAVPAHDTRDKEFAERFFLPVVEVINEEGIMMHSKCTDLNVDGLHHLEAAKKIIAHLEKTVAGTKSVTFRLRDWLFSRQRYWGEPFPILHVLEGKDAGQKRLLADQLPVLLPNLEKYQPAGNGESPLATATAWVETKDPVTGAKARRETNTMPQWAGSCWYYLRYMDPKNSTAGWSKEAEKYWGQVDLYVGGAEHAVLHLLYARFWHKVLFENKLVSHSEPFKRLVHQGMILGEDGEKMSKSIGNVINPDALVEEYGADTIRLYEMFMGPLEKAKPWSSKGIEGVYRFLSRYLRLVLNEDGSKISANASDIPSSQWGEEFERVYHKTIQQVGEDIEGLRFNTAISTLMILLNEAYAYNNAHKKVPKEFIQTFTQLIAPFCPHAAEEVWSLLGNSKDLTNEAWPKFDASKTIADTFELAIQVNGKLRDTVQVSRSIAEAELKPMVLEREQVKKWMEGKPLKKFIYVKGKLASVVV